MSTKFHFTFAEDEKLTEYVGNRPSLYDSNHKDYKNLAIRENMWLEISEAVQRTVVDCKKRWRNIKDTYMKLRRNRNFMGKPRSKWPLIEHLKFMDDLAFERNCQGSFMDDANIVELEDSHSNEVDPFLDDSVEPFLTPVQQIGTANINNNKRTSLFSCNINGKRRKDENGRILDILQKRSAEREKMIQSIASMKADETDPVLLFFKSMGMTVRTFEPELIAEAKSRIFNIVHELEIKSIGNKQPVLQLSNTLISRPETSASESHSDASYSNFSPFSDCDLTQF